MIESGPKSVSTQAGAASRGYSLWISSYAQLAGQREQIAPHIPVIDKSKRDDGTFLREDFTFDKSMASTNPPSSIQNPHHDRQDRE